MKNNCQFKFIRITFLTIFSGITMLLGAQSSSDGSFPQYLFPEFKDATLLMKNGQSQSAMMNYNTVTERMVYKKDGKMYDLIIPENLDTIYIQNRIFIPAGKMFYEVILKGTHLALFIQQKGTLLSAGAPAAYGGTSQVSSVTSLSSIELSGGRYNIALPSDFIVNPSPVYWIRKENEMFSFLNEKQFLKIFPDKEKELKLFIKGNRIKIGKPEDLAKLVRYCDGLIK